MASVMKKFGKMQQWTREKMGKAQKTETSDEFQDCQQNAEGRIHQNHLIFEDLEDYLKVMGGNHKEMPIETLGKDMTALGNKLDDDSDYGKALLKTGDTFSQVARSQLEYVKEVKAGIHATLYRFDAEAKEYSRLKKKLESRRLDLDAKTTRLQKSKSEKPKYEEDMRAAKAKYEETLRDITEKMVAINTTEDEHLYELLQFVESQVNYFSRNLEMMQRLQNDLRKYNQFSERPLSSFDRTPLERSSSAMTMSSTASSTRSSIDSIKDRDFHDNGALSSSYNNSHSRLVQPQPNNYATNTTLVPPPPPSRRTSERKFTKQVKVLFDFDAEGHDELTIRKGEIINVVTEVSEGWWEGQIDGQPQRYGLFPSNYTEEIKVLEAVKPPPPVIRRSATAPVLSSSNGHSVVSNGHSVVNGHSTSNGHTSTPPFLSQVQQQQQAGKCPTCDCNDFKIHMFKKGYCNGCYHQHF